MRECVRVCVRSHTKFVFFFISEKIKVHQGLLRRVCLVTPEDREEGTACKKGDHSVHKGTTLSDGSKSTRVPAIRRGSRTKLLFCVYIVPANCPTLQTDSGLFNRTSWSAWSAVLIYTGNMSPSSKSDISTTVNQYG